MKKITFAFTIMLLAIFMASCQSKEEQATKLVKTFWRYASDRSDSAVNIYPDYVDSSSPTSIQDLAQIGDLSITSIDAIPNSDSCVVIGSNSYYDDNGELQRSKVKFYVCEGQIRSSFGLISPPAKLRVLLKKSGFPCDGNDFYDADLAKENKSIIDFANFIDKYCGGEEALKRNFQGDEYTQFCNASRFYEAGESQFLENLIVQINNE